MYIDNNPNWKKISMERRVYIFGGGEKGHQMYHKLKDNGINSIAGVIDNNPDVVDRFNSGNGWVDKAFLTKDYAEVNDDRKDIIIISTHPIEVKKQLIGLGIYNCITEEEIDLSNEGETHYNEEYFNMQLEYAKVDSELDKVFFQRFIKPSDKVLEFGCGGGLLLSKLKCKEKMGVEINPFARKYAKTMSISTVKTLNELDDAFYDVIISSHALEHCLNPYEIASNMFRKLREGGINICVVPYEPLSYEYHKNDPSQHLYIWNERALGNLFRAAGFYIRETGTKEVAWPEEWQFIFEKQDIPWFNAISALESFRTGYYSVYVIAEK